MNSPMWQVSFLLWGQIIIKIVMAALGIYTMILAIKALKIYIDKNRDF